MGIRDAAQLACKKLDSNALRNQCKACNYPLTINGAQSQRLALRFFTGIISRSSFARAAHLVRTLINGARDTGSAWLIGYVNNICAAAAASRFSTRKVTTRTVGSAQPPPLFSLFSYNALYICQALLPRGDSPYHIHIPQFRNIMQCKLEHRVAWWCREHGQKEAKDTDGWGTGAIE